MRANEFINQQQLKEHGVAECFQVNEGLGDWITKKIDDYLGPSSISSDDISRYMKAAPPNLPDDVAKQLTDAFLKKAETQRLLQQAAEAQKTTVQKIEPYLTYVARMFIDRWKQIPQADRQDALRNLGHNLMRFLMFVLETLAKSMVKKEGVSEESANEQQLKELNVVKTLDYIKNAHGDQLYGKLPYWTHPRAVALTGRKIFGNKFTPDAVKTAFLHDVIEDTNTSLSELAKLGFSTQVINAVGLLTKDNTLSYEQNIKKIIQSGNPLAMMVKYADNTENFGGDKSAMSSDRRNRLQTKYRASLDMLAQALGINT
jgi:hypothetical protein